MTQHKGEPPLLIGEHQSVRLLVNSWMKPGPFIALNWENTRSDYANLNGGFHLKPDECEALIASLQSALEFARTATKPAAVPTFDTTEEIPF